METVIYHICIFIVQPCNFIFDVLFVAVEEKLPVIIHLTNVITVHFSSYIFSAYS